MKITRVSNKYARAAFDVLSASGKLREALDQLKHVAAIADGDATLQKFMRHPRVTAAQKVEMVRKAFGSLLSGTALELVLMLARRGRFRSLQAVVHVLEERVLEAEGVVRASVTTAVPLEEEQKRQIHERLGRMTGKRVELGVHTDPKLIGGIVIQVGDRLIDGSVKSQLEKLRENLLSVRIAS